MLAWQAVSLAPRRDFPLPETPRTMALVPGDADASSGSSGPKVKSAVMTENDGKLIESRFSVPL